MALEDDRLVAPGREIVVDVVVVVVVEEWALLSSFRQKTISFFPDDRAKPGREQREIGREREREREKKCEGHYGFSGALVCSEIGATCHQEELSTGSSSLYLWLSNSESLTGWSVSRRVSGASYLFQDTKLPRDKYRVIREPISTGKYRFSIRYDYSYAYIF